MFNFVLALLGSVLLSSLLLLVTMNGEPRDDEETQRRE